MSSDYKYMVCTECMTFNHERFIRDALEGFVKQETKFPVVNVVVDDASTDNTARVITDYMNEQFDMQAAVAYQKETTEANVCFAPHKTNTNCYFAVLLLKKNYRRRYLKLPFIQEWLSISKYHAMCEGDDYWVDSLKLQKQVDYMEFHPECSMCCHNAYLENDKNGERKGIHRIYKRSQIVEKKHLFRDGGFLPTASYMMRQELFGKEYFAFPINPCAEDIRIQIYATMKGIVFYINEPMSVYRLHGESVTHLAMMDPQILIERHERQISWYKEINGYTQGVFHDEISHAISFREASIFRLRKKYLRLWNPRYWPYLSSLRLSTRLGLWCGMLGLYFIPSTGKKLKNILER